MAKLRRAQELLNAKDLASTIEKLATFFNQRKDPQRKDPMKNGPMKNGNLKKEISDATQKDSKIETKTSHNQKNVNPSSIKINNEIGNQTDNKSANPRSRYIPAKTRRRVYRQAMGQCSYIDPKSGRRCSERTHLQVDHIRPFAREGDHSLSNLQLLCRSHNLMRARDDFGASFIQAKITGQPPLATGQYRSLCR